MARSNLPATSKEQMMTKTRCRWANHLILVGLFILVVALMMLPSYQLLVKPRGRSFDFFAFWMGGRAVLAGENPYGSEVTRLIQLGVYRQAIPPQEYQHGFPLPAHAALVLLPLFLLPYSWSVLLWLSLQIPLFLVTLLLGLNVLNWSIRPAWLFLLAILTTLGFRYPVIAYVLGQVTIFVLFCLVLSVWLYQRNQPRWAAVTFACATIRPDLALAAILAAPILTRKSARRNEFFVAFLAAGIVFLFVPILLTGDFWPFIWLKQVQAYGGGNPNNSWPLALLPSLWLTLLLVIVLTIWLGCYTTTVWRQATPFNQSLFVSAMILVGLIILPQTGAYTLILALIPAVILIRYAASDWLRLILAGALLTPWLYFALGMDRTVFLLIPLQFVLLQEIVRYRHQRKAYT
jgi:hypothetical protein